MVHHGCVSIGDDRIGLNTLVDGSFFQMCHLGIETCHHVMCLDLLLHLSVVISYITLVEDQAICISCYCRRIA